jgi:hypothetical protein
VNLLSGSSEGKKTLGREEIKLPTFFSAVSKNDVPLCPMTKFENCNSRIVCDCIYNIYVIYAGCNYLASLHMFFNCLLITLLMSAGSMLVADEALTHNRQVWKHLFSSGSLKTHVYA